ncbi:pyrimidine reductase family protein [Rhodococcus spelaei]|uniref:pyrimidine reductase family protein n=1 Tax=Rhodococcus spelaei TaxID=2546320 RepID=UPI0015EF2F3E|nr:pyrimidine reductase family protein [Rhodococcus spelaei]
MHHLDNATYLTALHDDALRDLHRYPDNPSAPWIRVNFVASIDGAVSTDGTSGGLGTPADHRLFTILRELADVVLVGAGTVRAENYGGARTDPTQRARRRARGQSDTPPIAVVTAGAHVDPSSRLLVDTDVAPLILTCTEAPAARKRALADAGARVLEIGHGAVGTAAIVSTLGELGLHRVLCEGGPSLFGQLLADDAVDELCLTTSPMLVGGGSGRIASSPRAGATAMRRAHVLGDDDGTVLTRWVRERGA